VQSHESRQLPSWLTCNVSQMQKILRVFALLSLFLGFTYAAEPGGEYDNHDEGFHRAKAFLRSDGRGFVFNVFVKWRYDAKKKEVVLVGSFRGREDEVQEWHLTYDPEKDVITAKLAFGVTKLFVVSKKFPKQEDELLNAYSEYFEKHFK